MGLPMLNKAPKASTEDPATKSAMENARDPPVHEPTAGPSSTIGINAAGNIDERTVRWERLQTLRNRLVDRMYRLEMEDLLNSSSNRETSSNNNPTEGAAGSRSDSQHSGSASSSSRPVPIPIGRAIQLSGAPSSENGIEVVRSWVALHHGNGVPEALRAEGEEDNTQQRRQGGETDAQRGASGRRRAVDSGEALLTLDEFLRESRANREVGDVPVSSSSQNSSVQNPSQSRAGDRRGQADDPVISVPQTLPAATWWTLPAGQYLAPSNQETFDTFINHIRRIGQLQDAMLATIRSTSTSSASSPAESTATGGQAEATQSRTGTTTASGTTNSGSSEVTLSPLTQALLRSTATSTTTPAAANGTNTGSSTSNNASNASSISSAEARLRAMQTRMDILASEFSLLRSTWAMSHVETQGYERSLRRLQEYLPSARRAERLRRGERGSAAALNYDELYGEAAREELFPRNPWGDSEAERNRERLRIAAAWALARGESSRNQGSGSGATEGTAASGAVAASGGTASNVLEGSGVGTTATQRFSPSERELQKDLLAAKMEELILKGMR
ncbi:hypothetical protein BDZ91DRAFT_738820 [Kalaharituber pfeilii]|nr:hypothetical protein BDZ91DRAFT_738820 [Kalaharituber pfeilii]